jgi:hypothetical protein
MENLYLKGNLKFPTLDFNAQTGVFEIKGRSLPEHAVEFYKPVVEWLDEYKKSPQPKTVINVSLEYFNTSSSKMILDVFKKIQQLHKDGIKLEVNWHYEEDDPDMLDQGETFREILKIPINIIPVKE